MFVDSSLTFLGVFVFDERLDNFISENFILSIQGCFCPLWLITLWAVFAATIAHSLHFLSRSKILQFIVGFIFAPLSYIGGAALLAVNLRFGELMTYFILGPIWGGLMILFFYLKERLYRQDTS
jgi:hypothetical protein